jgi:hypothetical protein
VYFNFPDDLAVTIPQYSGTVVTITPDPLEAAYVLSPNIRAHFPDGIWGNVQLPFESHSILAYNRIGGVTTVNIKSHPSLLGGGVVTSVDCDSPVMQYIWVDPYEVAWDSEFRNIQVGDDLAQTYIYTRFPSDLYTNFSGSIPDTTFMSGTRVRYGIGDIMAFRYYYRNGSASGLMAACGPTVSGLANAFVLWSDSGSSGEYCHHAVDRSNSSLKTNMKRNDSSFGSQSYIVEYINSGSILPQYFKVKISDMP